MEMPQELEVWYIIPALRREFARSMLKKGLKQRDTAKKLGIAESAVCHYMKSKRAKLVKFDRNMQKEITKSVNKVLENKSTVMREMQTMILKIRKAGILCKLHKQKINGCEVCMR